MTLNELIATIKDTANGHSFLVVDDQREMATVNIIVTRKARKRIFRRKTMRFWSDYVLPMGIRVKVLLVNHAQFKEMSKEGCIPEKYIEGFPDDGNQFKFVSCRE